MLKCFDGGVLSTLFIQLLGGSADDFISAKHPRFGIRRKYIGGKEIALVRRFLDVSQNLSFYAS